MVPQDIVRVIVGPSEQTFAIHKGFACSRSPFFKAAFGGQFEEAKTGELILDATDPEIFGLFVNLMYTNKIEERLCIDEPPCQQKFERDNPTCKQLFELWLLAGYLQVPALQNRVVEYIKKRFARHDYYYVELWELPLIYDQTAPGSALRKFFVDALAASSLKSEFFASKADSFPQEMFYDLFIEERALTDCTRDGVVKYIPKSLADKKKYYIRSNPSKLDFTT